MGPLFRLSRIPPPGATLLAALMLVVAFMIFGVWASFAHPSAPAAHHAASTEVPCARIG